MNARGVYLHRGSWVAAVKVYKKATRIFFSIKKHGERAMSMAAEAREKLLSESIHKITCQHCQTEFSWKPSGKKPKFCRDACRVSHFHRDYKEKFQTAYRARYYQPARPPYERPDIPYERETEIPLLTSLRQAVGIDSEDSYGRSLHEIISSGTMAPDEYLMMKEMETPEYLERLKMVREYERFERTKHWIKKQDA